MTPAALAANKANAQKAGRPKGKISLSDISFRDRCRVRDEEHIAILEHIARYSENDGFRLAAIRDLFDRGRGQACFGTGWPRSGICSIEGAVKPVLEQAGPTGFDLYE